MGRSTPRSAFSCGDGICQDHESNFSCSDDCFSGGPDGYCDKQKDEICDKDCVPESLDPDYPECLKTFDEKYKKDDIEDDKGVIDDKGSGATKTEEMDSGDEGGFLSKYWPYIVGFVVILFVIIGVLVFKNRNSGEEQY